jgi:serine/threonine protein kinase
VVFEFLPNGDLLTKIRCKEIKPKSIPSIFKAICSAVDYLHRQRIIHRNLKAESVLLDQQMNPKIVDLGLAAPLTKRNTFCGCYSYMAPELLLKKEYDHRVDIWALGVILHEMAHGKLPFEGHNEP